MHKLLVIDDSDADCALIRDIAEPQGYQVQALHSLEQANETIAAFKPDVIMIDFLLGRETGLDFIMELTNKGQDPKNIIFMTAYSSRELEEDALAMGASHFINKEQLDQQKLCLLLDDLTTRSQSLVMPEDAS